ncbi:MAG: DUF5663 domain-containing protein [bacterium]|nr:DUF5663 domain-containing protein [bacterium]
MNPTNLSPVLEALELNELPVEEQEALLVDLNELIFKGTMVRLIELMDESSRDEFAKLMESGADEAVVEAFLREKVPNADRAVEETVAELADDILAVTGTNKE